jgi:hypothetical protein
MFLLLLKLVFPKRFYCKGGKIDTAPAGLRITGA